MDDDYYSNIDDDVLDDENYEEDIPENEELNQEEENNEENDGDDDADIDEEDVDENSILNKIRENKQEIVPFTKTYENYYSQKKITKPFITKYERAKILGVRAEMIASGARPTITVPPGITIAYDIALLEYKAKKIPLLIRRHLPNGSIEDWRLEDLVI
jgi:DNA-directed RNA polymerase I, II, and III subunit RPABC2